MLDRKLLREDPAAVKARLARRGAELPELVDKILDLDVEERRVQTELDNLRQQRNEVSKEIGKLMKAGDAEGAEERKGFVKTVNESIEVVEARFEAIQEERTKLLSQLPNIPDDAIPDGGEEAKHTVKYWGDPKRFQFKAHDHVELAASLNLIDFEAARRVSGSGFQFFVGMGAILERALVNFMLDTHVEVFGRREVRPPFIVKPEAAFGAGHLPKFKEEMYHVYVPVEEMSGSTEGNADYYLIATSEVPMCYYFGGMIIPPGALPQRFVAYSPCWRVEGGHYGRETRGLRRVHQFEKVELFSIVEPKDDEAELEQMTLEAERILEMLGLPYRRVLLPAGDMGFASAKTYDLEIHAAVTDEWLEVSSCSTTRDFQSRRSNVRFRREDKARPEFVHMLNASGVALPRLMVALLENYQLENGNVAVPDVLQKYMGRAKFITPPEKPIPFLD
jgi:seryl-tRNA synthetase